MKWEEEVFEWIACSVTMSMVEASITDKVREFAHCMFRRSNSWELFFLRRETNSKENAVCRKKKNHEYGNCYKVCSI